MISLQLEFQGRINLVKMNFQTKWVLFKDIHFCPIEIIKGLIDKGQFQYHKIKEASRGDLPVYNTISFTKIKINILS